MGGRTGKRNRRCIKKVTGDFGWENIGRKKIRNLSAEPKQEFISRRYTVNI